MIVESIESAAATPRLLDMKPSRPNDQTEMRRGEALSGSLDDHPHLIATFGVRGREMDVYRVIMCRNEFMSNFHLMHHGC